MDLKSVEDLLDARHAGMSEVATSVLHNVGNILNSITVASSQARNSLRRARIADLTDVASLLLQHETDFGRFLETDDRATHLPRLLDSLGAHLMEVRGNVLEELDVLAKGVDHMRQVISAQQDDAVSKSVLGRVELTEVVADALQLTSTAVEEHDIAIDLALNQTPDVLADRHQLLKILVNLLLNAKDSLARAPVDAPTIRVELRGVKGRCVRLSVADNGRGIAAENLEKLFQYGFTTKHHGHGFGLYSCAHTASQLGGTLTAQSAGHDRGATFTLELPRHANAAHAGARMID